ncbi:precorrin-6A synthase (deacetylating) [Mumia zhuanghuii]|uniref:Precorrin-6A synthase (Deacetylating) n=2 Tax=Mumia TaxID=1546255 RepID=A0ABW1QPL0_9ACTN|nr:MULTISPECIES: precorrin-6A synthase (deacetylating) [Mumia]KAA1424431.1 precorrin-6A synthase (deacetylating) [Mumia zhuanghuii]
MTRRVVLIGIGPGDPDQVTVEAVRAMNEVAYVVVSDKRRRDGDEDPLLAAREAILARHVAGEVRLVVVEDPERDRSPAGTATAAAYEQVVADWHEARAQAYAEVLRAHDGDAGFLVWGDPAFYDSLVRILRRVAEIESLRLEVVPGISSLQLLAARHAIVLHEVGQPIHVTTGRRLQEAIAQGQDNVVVMLNRSLDDLRTLDGQAWRIWWGANLGTAHEALVAGRLDDVLPDVERARAAAKAAAGWVMDVYLLRRDR